MFRINYKLKDPKEIVPWGEEKKKKPYMVRFDRWSALDRSRRFRYL